MRNKELVKWSETGDSIIITDINTFSDKILPEYFNHNNYSSFIRQLNMYGFRKQNKEKKTKQEEYKNEFFKKDCKDLLKNITRKKRTDEEIQEKGVNDRGRNGADYSGKNRGLINEDFDEGFYIRPEIVKDHEDVARRVNNLLKSYDDLAVEKDNIGNTIDRVEREIDEMKQEFSTKLDLMMNFLVNQYSSSKYKKSASGNSPSNNQQQSSLVFPASIKGGGMNMLEGSTNATNNILNNANILNFLRSRQKEGFDQTQINLRRLDIDIGNSGAPHMLDWDQSSNYNNQSSVDGRDNYSTQQVIDSVTEDHCLNKRDSAYYAEQLNPMYPQNQIPRLEGSLGEMAETGYKSSNEGLFNPTGSGSNPNKLLITSNDSEEGSLIYSPSILPRSGDYKRNYVRSPVHRSDFNGLEDFLKKDNTDVDSFKLDDDI